MTSVKQQAYHGIKSSGDNEAEAVALIHDRIKRLISSDKLFLFIKGSPGQPRCKFSRQLLTLLDQHNIKYSTYDILEDEVRM